MQLVTDIEFLDDSRQERLPGFVSDFPCITSCAHLDMRTRPAVPWHWHRAIELFYIKSGELEYCTPNGCITLGEGCGGFVNSGILHMTTHSRHKEETIQLLHLFEPAFLAGESGSRIDQKYIRPITASAGIEMIPLFPDCPEHEPILRAIRESFFICREESGYEIRLRDTLSRLWLMLFGLVQDQIGQIQGRTNTSDRVKRMMIHIHEHYAQPISISSLAKAAICSERECYRSFHECLHMTPLAYLQSYRLQIACQKISSGHDSLTEIAHSCGFGSSSYLGKVFRGVYGCTPMEYRRKGRMDTQAEHN